MAATAVVHPEIGNRVKLNETIKALEAIKEPIKKYMYLRQLSNDDSDLYYSLLFHQTEEILPFIYTPTVGAVCEQYHTLPITTRGLYIRITDKGNILEKLKEWPGQENIKVVVVTDGERILGLGDQGANGIGISEGKITLYTGAAGVDPYVCLPMALDVGTDNQQLREHPQYKGLRRERARGAEYDEFIEEFVTAVKRWQPHVLVQWEDFGNKNAFRILEKYQDVLCCFNDDIQGTASITLAAMLSALRVQKKQPGAGAPDDWKVVFLGAGEAGVGIAELISDYCQHRLGQSVEEARKRCVFVDSKGLVCSSRDNLQDHKKLYAHDLPFQPDLKATLKAVKPQVLIGVSTIQGTFDQEVIEMMCSWTPRPVIMPLSNPTDKAECTFQQAWEWSHGKVLFASGSAFDPITTKDGVVHSPAQANNAYIFPAIGHAAVLTQCRCLTRELFLEAAETLSRLTSLEDADSGELFPPFHKILDVSADIMDTVCSYIVQKGLGQAPADKEESTSWRDYCRSHMWTGIRV